MMSPIGYNKAQKEIARTLGLGKMHSFAIQEDTPDIMGKVAKIAHLVTVEKISQ